MSQQPLDPQNQQAINTANNDGDSESGDQITVGDTTNSLATAIGNRATSTVNFNISHGNSEEQDIKKQKFKSASPYQGLYKFETKDKDKFFGRENVTEEIANKVLKDDVLFLIGASGSGKSSLVQAGLIPYLENDWSEANGKFFTINFEPDTNPFQKLYESLDKAKKYESKIKMFTKDEFSIIEVVKKVKDNDFWLIFIDQFEQIFTIEKEKRANFIAALSEFIKYKDEKKDKSVKIVLAMRADFSDRFNDYPYLVDIVNKYQYTLGKMANENLKLAIKSPAKRNGVVVAENLVERIIGDFTKQDVSLPLLEYTLDLLWTEEKNKENGTKIKQERELTYETYISLGGVSSALKKRANDIYKKYNTEQKKAFENIFFKLIKCSENEVVSRVEDKGNFANDEITQKILQEFIENYFLVSYSDSKNKPKIKIAHEKLFESWDVIKELIDKNQEILPLRGYKKG